MTYNVLSRTLSRYATLTNGAFALTFCQNCQCLLLN